MPSTLWTAPVPGLGSAAGPTVTTAALVDASPEPPVEMPPFTAVGQRVRVRAFGDYSTSATGANITWGLYHGAPGVVIGSALVLAASAATASVSSTSVAWPWMLEYEFEVRALTTKINGLGSVYGQGRLYTPTSITAPAMQFLPITAALRTVAVDTSTTRQLMLGITLSATTGVVGFTCQHLNAEAIG